MLFAPEAQYTRDLLAAIPHPTFEPEHADADPGGGRIMTRRPRKAKVRAQGRRAEAARPQAGEAPQRDPLDDFIAASARALDLKIDKAWMPAVRGQSCRSRCASARWSAAFALPDDAEPAPVFKA